MTATALSETRHIPSLITDLSYCFDLSQQLGGLSYYEIDFTSGLTTGTPFFFEQFGLPGDKGVLSRAEWFTFVHPDDRDAVSAHLRTLPCCHGIVTIEYRIVPNNGSVRWVASRARLTRDDAGRLVRASGVQQDVTERREAEERARWNALHDPLTNLANRAYFDERLNSFLSARQSGALLLLDLDRFKDVNDRFGHPVGDALLKQAARRLRTCVRGDDLIARLGGDEFAVLSNATAGVDSLAKRIIDIVSRPYLLLGCNALIGTSVGIAEIPADGSSGQAVVQAADLALYAAKADGRGTWRRYDVQMGSRAHSRHSMIDDLRRAAALGQLELHFQPLAAADRKSIIGFEALLRWRRPGTGLVPPGDFISLAEENGLICDIGEWALFAACREAMTWPGNLSVAVNVSPHQFDHGTKLVETVRSALEKSGLPPTRLELEITENALARGEDRALAQLHALRALGVRISIDDFGTGYSSLSRLLGFPFDRIKVDRSFVAALGRDKKAAALVQSIAALGTSLSMTTVAEGVETELQAVIVRDNGFTDIQGFLVSKPLPAADVPGFLATEIHPELS